MMEFQEALISLMDWLVLYCERVYTFFLHLFRLYGCFFFTNSELKFEKCLAVASA